MPIHFQRVCAGLALAAAVVVEPGCLSSPDVTALSDAEFWRLVTELGEPAGEFTHSENLVSNELQYVHTIRMLRRTGGFYIGVGPEQNFSFIARLEPLMAFVVDIRQENRSLHLMYKALFEMASDRREFVFRLFSRERPAGALDDASVQALFRELASARASSAIRAETGQRVRQHLLEHHRLPLTADDLKWIDHALDTFYAQGPELDYYGDARPAGEAAAPSYRTLMTATDVAGVSRSYLATDENFAFVKDLQRRNLIVPVVGDFSGPSAIRRVGAYVRDRGGLVTAFYGSNVSVYLSKQRLADFCGNLATLPSRPSTWFIENKGVRPLGSKLGACVPPAPFARP